MQGAKEGGNRELKRWRTVAIDKTRPFGTLEKMEAADVSSDGLIDLLYKLKAKYRKNAVWVMNSNTAAKLQKLKNGNGDYIWRDRLVAGSPDTLLGRPVQYLETMPDAEAGKAFLAVGDFKRGYFIVDHTTGPDSVRGREQQFAVCPDLRTGRRKRG